MTPPPAPPPSLQNDRRRARSSWPAKFAIAGRGLRVGVQGQPSFCVHFFFAVLAVAALAVLKCPAADWVVVLLCVGLVFTAELMNTAVEILFRGFDQATRDRVYPALDVAAGAVLVASITAVAVGAVVFGRQLLVLMGYLDG